MSQPSIKKQALGIAILESKQMIKVWQKNLSKDFKETRAQCFLQFKDMTVFLQYFNC
jgi:hypothetical protein